MRLSERSPQRRRVKPDSYLGQVLISRLNSDSTRRQLRASLRDSLGNVVEDISLQERR